MRRINEFPTRNRGSLTNFKSLNTHFGCGPTGFKVFQLGGVSLTRAPMSNADILDELIWATFESIQSLHVIQLKY